jgi:site-specific DNA-methyltransferase (adenine-specific)
MGTGTTAIAAKKLGRKFIGIDIDSKYVEITNKKLEDVQPTLINGCYVSNFLDNVITVRDKDWDKIKEAFFIPRDPLELEKREIYLLHKNGKRVKYRMTESIQSDLFSICGEDK